MRAERRAARAAARAELRARYAHYKKLVAVGDAGEEGYLTKVKRLRAEKRATLNHIAATTKAEKAQMRKTTGHTERFKSLIEINERAMRKTLQAHANYETKHQALLATRLPPLTWREWLFEEAQLGDTVALSALRGIVYQEQRDAAKRARLDEGTRQDTPAQAAELKTDAEYRQAMARLLEEEKKELAIRAASSSLMRPYEADVLLRRYNGIQWRVTENGNVRYSDNAGKHLFTDRGNRVTFDRVRVTDEEIRLALLHSRQKFGNRLTLTGDNALFTERMARIADDMGITVLNPELQETIARHRAQRALQRAAARYVPPVQAEPMRPIGEKPATPEPQTPAPEEPAVSPQEQTAADASLDEQIQRILDPNERLRAQVLAIDPQAIFIIPDPKDTAKRYHGPIVAILEDDTGMAQHIGRRTYALHALTTTEKIGTSVDVSYRDGKLAIAVDKGRGGRGRGK